MSYRLNKNFLLLLSLFMVCSFFSCLNVNAGQINGEFIAKKGKVRPKKLKCVFYGNCQVAFIYNYLKTNFPHYECYYVCNWQAIQDQAAFPLDIIKQADVFIYQPLAGYGALDTDYLKGYLPQKCNCISCPYLYFSGYFPDCIRGNERNASTISAMYPFGRFPTMQHKLDELIIMGYSLSEVIALSRAEDFLSAEVVLQTAQQSLNILKEKESLTNVKLANFIEKHYAQQQLFQSPWHPTTALFKELLKQVFALMNLPLKGIENNAMLQQEPDLYESPLIYPCVAKALNLQFDTEKIACMGAAHVSYATYIQEYIRYLFPEYHKEQ
jgi:hypothetical protein